jgi:hypothetical protein
MWWKRLSPFRVAVVLYLGYQLFVFITTPSNFSSGGGNAWGGVAVIALLFWAAVLWLGDMLFRKLVSDIRVLVVIELLVLLAMYVFLDW